MARQTSRRVLAVALVLAVVLLATHAVGHWHANPFESLHCQACQMGHAAVQQPAVHMEMQRPIAIAPLAFAETFRADLGFVGASRVPRAPPA
jgi:hypothetical protein